MASTSRRRFMGTVGGAAAASAAAPRAGVSAPRSARRGAIAADVVSDGRYLGQITEAVVEVETA